MTRRRRPTSRAAVILADAGLTLGDVASRLEITPQALSLQFSGTTNAWHPHLATVLAELVGAEVTGEILYAIAAVQQKAAEEAHLDEVTSAVKSAAADLKGD